MNTASQRLFTWNRAHWIGMVSLTMLMTLLVFGSSAFIITYEENAKLATTPDHFIWLSSMVWPWSLALGLANIILGSIRTGSLSFPVASTILGPLGFGWGNLRLRPGYQYLTWSEWVSLMHTDGLQLIGQTLYGMSVLFISYAAIAFICYAIGRYGLRVLFVDPDPQSLSGRLLGWIRFDTVRFGCWLAVTLAYGLLLAMVIASGNAALGAALMINFVIPPLLLVVCGIYASRSVTLSHPWRALAFPLMCSVVPIPLLIGLIQPLSDTCAVASMCTTIGSWYFNWSQMSQVCHFTLVFTIASFLGFGAVWTTQWVFVRLRKH